jgi:two-component system OmpR family response regulator
MPNPSPALAADVRRILVVDDEFSMRDLVTTALEFVGFEVRSAADGSSGLEMAQEFSPHVIVLDVNMPGLDGLEMCRRLRAAGDSTPIIFLTARDAVEDTVAAFASGADDYLTKPFHLQILIARVRAVLKRTAGSGSPTMATAGQQATGVVTPGRIGCGGLELDETTHRVWRDGERVELSPTEYRLLRYLLLNAGVVVSKGQILDDVWKFDFGGDTSVVETYMSTLRRKVDRPDARLLHTVRGFGYVVRLDDRQ